MTAMICSLPRRKAKEHARGWRVGGFLSFYVPVFSFRWLCYPLISSIDTCQLKIFCIYAFYRYLIDIMLGAKMIAQWDRVRLNFCHFSRLICLFIWKSKNSIEIIHVVYNYYRIYMFKICVDNWLNKLFVQ